MPGEGPQPAVAPSAIVGGVGPEAVLLEIGDGLHHKAQGEDAEPGELEAGNG